MFTDFARGALEICVSKSNLILFVTLLHYPCDGSDLLTRTEVVGVE